jgi:hypothetical protein
VMMKQEIIVNTKKLSVYLDNIFKFTVGYNYDRNI